MRDSDPEAALNDAFKRLTAAEARITALEDILAQLLEITKVSVVKRTAGLGTGDPFGYRGTEGWR